MLILGTISITFLISAETNIVDAQSTSNVCCEKTKNGAWCQNDLSSNCDSNYKNSPTDCKDTDYCMTGCCVSQATGICDINVPKANCDKNEFQTDPSCNVQDCKKGCCTLGNNAQWITEKNCQIQSNFSGYPVNFSTAQKSDVDCLFSVNKEELGACILDTSTRNCAYITLDECNIKTKTKGSVNPNFYQGLYCSDPQLNTSCKATDHKGCLDGKEDVYWFDSCKNSESVAQNCDILKDSNYCGKVNADYVCKDVSCNINGKKRKNGESWCSYDEVIGKGKDPAGSRNIRHICDMGIEKIEPCSDYRNEVCVESESSIIGGENISQAACRVNNWRKCYSYDTQEEDQMTKNCNNNPDCMIRNVDVDEKFKFNVCVPQYPPGFDLIPDEQTLLKQAQDNQETKSSSETLCGLASQMCTVVKKCSIFGGCSIIVNGNCLEKTFTQQMNEFCVNLGDCGAYINYNNDITDDGYSITSDAGDKPPRLSDQDILSLKNSAGTKPIPPGELDILGASTSNNNIIDLGEIQNNISAFETEIQSVPGALGSALLEKILSNSGSLESLASKTTPTSVNLAGFSNEISTIQSGTIVDYQLANIMGLPTESVIAGAIGGILGALVGYLISESLYGALFGGLILGLILFFLFFVKIKYIHINFKCMPWQPPTEGNCDKCNQNLSVPCTQYRCESLGLNCQLINVGTADELCSAKTIETSVPIIKPWTNLITKGYSYYNINDNSFQLVNSSNNGCIEPFTNIKFGIKTVGTSGNDMYTQCKYDLDPAKSYDDMVDFFDDYHPNSYLPFHEKILNLPSPQAFKDQYNLTNEQIKKLGDIKFYVRCKNLKGIQNPNPFQINFCINPSPDLTAPVINSISPVTNSFLKYGVTDQYVTMFVNEPSNCRWSTVDKTYGQMENSFSCDQDLNNRTIYGWKCYNTFTNIINSSNYFIRCQDLSPNKNNMSTSFQYNLNPSPSPLYIDNIDPYDSKTIVSGVNPVQLTLRLETTGGANNGVAVCMWKGNGFGPDTFTETNSTEHSYLLQYAPAGSYTMTYDCIDSAGNTAENITTFNINIDDIGPKITRVYKGNSGELELKTDEDSKCRYSFNRLDNLENATLMSGTSTDHSADWNINGYFIQCTDSYGNKGGVFKIKTYEILG